MLFMVNSCVNPLIYAKLHRSFQQCTLQLCCTCLSKRYFDYSRRKSLWSTVSVSFVSTSRRLSESMIRLRERRRSSSSSTCVKENNSGNKSKSTKQSSQQSSPKIVQDEMDRLRKSGTDVNQSLPLFAIREETESFGPNVTHSAL